MMESGEKVKVCSESHNHKEKGASKERGINFNLQYSVQDKPSFLWS